MEPGQDPLSAWPRVRRSEHVCRSSWVPKLPRMFAGASAPSLRQRCGDVVTPSVDTAKHQQVAGWGGIPGACGVECACGTTFDGFDSIAEALVLLDQHIADHAPAPTFTRAQIYTTLAGAVEAGYPAPERVHLFESIGHGPWLQVHLSNVAEAEIWGRWVDASEPWVLHIPDNRHTIYEWVGTRGGWRWKFVGAVPDVTTTEALVAALLTPDAEPVPAGVQGVAIGGRVTSDVG